MAEIVLFNMTERVLSKLASLALTKMSLASDVETELNKLEKTLSTIKAVLLDAQNQQHKNHEVKDWLQKLQDAIYDADDLLDDYSIQTQPKKAVGRCFSFQNPIIYRFKIGHKLKQIRETLDEISADRRNFHFSEKPAFSQVENKARGQRQTHSFVQSSDIIGRDKDKDSVVKLLRLDTENENVSVIPIVGLGGLGKTTLMKLVYTDPWVVENFPLRMWVSISEDFSLNKVVEKIIKSATGETLGHLDMDQMQARLREVLTPNRFLLVLDDVWNEDRSKWIDLRDLLIAGCRGSKIVITTRSGSVAKITGTVPSFDLSGLSDDDCLSLFLRYAFQREEDWQQNLVIIGKEIVKKSGGVPLAAKTLGSLLYMKTDEREWLHIRDNDLWEIEQKENDILPILRLSYEQMPSYLRQCFAYCSMLPKNTEIPRETFVNLWIAQGFVTSSPNGKRALEDIGSRYFSELLSMFCFQDVVEAFDGEILACKIHSLVHDLAQSVAGAEFSSAKLGLLSERVRHVMFCSEDFSGEEFPEELLKARKMRSFSYSCEVALSQKSFVQKISLRFECLRVLVLKSLEINELPASIGRLKQLRYLTLSESCNLKSLPKSISSLVNLQTLDLINCESLAELPRNVNKLISLRTLYLTSNQTCFPTKSHQSLDSVQFLLLFQCRYLTSLSQGFQSFSKLRVLRIYDCPRLAFLPSSIRYLCALEKLWIWNCEELDLLEGEGMEGLKSLQSLLLMGLPKLVTLPEGLRGTAESLQYLRISDCSSMTRFPDWLEKFTSLLRLYIEDCPNISSLPNGVYGLAAKLHIVGCPKMRGQF